MSGWPQTGSHDGASTRACSPYVTPLRPALSKREWLAAFIRLGRPKFLLYSFLLFGLGTTFAAYEGRPIDLSWYVVGQVFIWCTHLMTHYCNEYFDLSADIANASPTSWTGGSRVLVEGTLRPAVSLGAALFLLVTSLALVVAMPTTGARAIMLGTIGLAWFYTAPPFRLNYRGFGELTVAAVLNLLTPALGCYLQMRELSPLFLLLCLPTMLLQHARMMVMGLSDYEGDQAIGKRTMPVLLGPKGTLAVVVAETSIAYGAVLLVTARAQIPPLVGAIFLSTLPLAVWQIRRLFRGAILDPRTNNSVVFWASTHVALVFCSVLVGLLVNSFADPARPNAMTGASVALSVAVLLAFGTILSFQIWRNRLRGVANAADLASAGPAPEANPLEVAPERILL